MIVILVILILLYPFLAAWLMGIGRGSRLGRLEDELEVLRRKVEAITSPAPPLPFTPLHTSATGQSPEPAPRVDTAGSPVEQVAQVEADVDAGSGPMSRQEGEAGSTSEPGKPVLQAVQAEPIVDRVQESRPVAPSEESGAPPAGTAGRPDEPPRGAAGAALPPASPPPRPGWAAAAMGWLFTGNLVAKLGLVILFIGVGFLLKYVAETVYIPIEARLAGVVAATLALLGWGWRMRSGRREIGLPVQGTAIAILMLVVFGAYHRYELIPAGFAFALLVALTAFTCLLAVLQESFWLAAFGITGGFASPLLLSTGQANHVGLFSYYALLNAGVFALAIKRAWRPLNLIGFAFTFIVGTVWGGLHYTPENYPSAQSFLALFFVFYVGIAVAFARQQQTRLKDYVDAVLVLGTPLLAFGLQAGLVKDKPFGLALSALALGVFYLSLGTVLWRRGGERWRVLVDTFVALGVIFGTLAIPFAVDGRWTSGMWALEGAGFVWVGLRRRQRMTWVFGVLLQAGAWMGFIGAATGLDPEAARDANLWLGFLLLAGSAFAIARGFRQHAGSEEPGLVRIGNWCLVIAAAWLLAGAWIEAILHTTGSLLANALAASALLTAGLLYLSGARLAWPLARRLAYGVQAAGALALLAASLSGPSWMNTSGSDHDEPLLGVLMIAVAALATSRLGARSPDRQADQGFSTVFLLWGGLWWFGPAMSIAASRFLYYLPDALGAPDTRWALALGLLVGASAIACARLAPRMDWPQLRWLGASSWIALALITFPTLVTLYGMRELPEAGVWLAWAVLWASGEYVLLRWIADNAALNGLVLRGAHMVRTAGPWLAIWPTGSILVERWLSGTEAVPDAAQQAGWAASPAWGNYLPTWLMMLVLAWLFRRSLAGTWPAAPLEQWYRRLLLPCAALLVLTLVAVWNLAQDGTMAPLPYLPLLNPLDLTTGFALVLCLGAARVLYGGRDGDLRLRRLQVGGLVVAYAWFNLILLRSAAQYRGIPYTVEELAASQFVQAMLSLVWCASALVLMRHAASKAMPRAWGVGAVLLGVVVLKLFTFDLSNSGSLARVVSFVGVGILMVLVGYFAPYPKTEKSNADALPST